MGCGTCATVCPTCALETRHPSDAQLLSAADERLRAGNTDLLFCCSCCSPEGTVVEPKTEVEVGVEAEAKVEVDSGAKTLGSPIALMCLSRMDESLAMQLFAKGAKKITLLHGECGDCPRQNGQNSFCLVEQTVRNIIDAWGLCAKYSVEAGFPTNSKDCVQIPEIVGDKGAHEGSSKHLSQESQKDSEVVHVQKDGTLPHFVPQRRHALLDALDVLGSPSQKSLDSHLWGHVRIDMSKCKSCKMCAVFCPTGALQKFSDADGVTGVEHYLAECVHCGLCQDVCPAGAIVSETDVPLQQLVGGKTERYRMPAPVWWTGPDQILRKMQPQISGREVKHSY